MTPELITARIEMLRYEANRLSGRDDDLTTLKLAVMRLIEQERGGHNRFPLPDRVK